MTNHPDTLPARTIPRVDAFQRRHPVLGFPIAVFYKYFDDTGPYLAALLTYYGFVSLFPLLLILSTVLGVVLDNDPGLRQDILDTAFAQIPVVGDQLGEPGTLQGSTLGLVLGGLGALYGGIGVAQAFQHAMNIAWSVPRNSRPNPFLARGRSIVLLVMGGIGVLATTAVVVSARSGLVSGGWTQLLVSVGSVLVSTALFAVLFHYATARPISHRTVLPGAVAAGIGLHLVQTFSIVYVNRVIANASTSNGVFAIVLGLIAFLYIGAVVVLLAAEINVVRAQRLYPRALLTPFTDSVVLTEGDKRSYIGQVRAQRLKGFQEIDVAFAPDEIQLRPARLREEAQHLADVWRRSVEATHDFLTRADVEHYHQRVRDEFLPTLDVTVADVRGEAVGFLGRDGDRIEMLFVDPTQHGRGVGSALLDQAMRGRRTIDVDVNEQNPSALAFYRAKGFHQVGRSPLDGDGRPFPILHLRRSADGATDA